MDQQELYTGCKPCLIEKIYATDWQDLVSHGDLEKRTHAGGVRAVSCPQDLFVAPISRGNLSNGYAIVRVNSVG